MIGSAIRIPAYAESLKVVKKGSVTLKVSGSLSPGSGPLAICSSRLFCQKQSAIDAARTTAEKMIRERSSSRCSTSVIRSSKLADFSRATAGSSSGA